MLHLPVVHNSCIVEASAENLPILLISTNWVKISRFKSIYFVFYLLNKIIFSTITAYFFQSLYEVSRPQRRLILKTKVEDLFINLYRYFRASHRFFIQPENQKSGPIKSIFLASVSREISWGKLCLFILICNKNYVIARIILNFTEN